MTRKQPETAGGAVKVTITLPPDLVRRLDALADAERRTRSNAAAVLLERALEHERQAG